MFDRFCSLVVAPLALAGLALGGAGCKGKNLAQRTMTAPTQELAAARCGGSNDHPRSLIVEWPATDRASLEGMLSRGTVVVRYDQCVVEVLRGCQAPGAYSYAGITRKHDNIRIRTEDELYANLPLSAVSFEAKLANAGELNVSMLLVGNYETDTFHVESAQLEGRCEQATHVIAAAQVGAFEFYAGSGSEIGAEVQVQSVAGAGGKSSASREILNRDGNPETCAQSSRDDTQPPPECGGLLRVELSPIANAQPAATAAAAPAATPAATPVQPARDQSQPSIAPAEAGLSANDQQLVTELCTWANRCLVDEGLDPYPVDECVRDESAAFDPRARADMQDCLDIAKGSCLDFFDTPMCTGG